jgi:hypothetical protein
MALHNGRDRRDRRDRRDGRDGRDGFPRIKAKARYKLNVTFIGKRSVAPTILDFGGLFLHDTCKSHCRRSMGMVFDGYFRQQVADTQSLNLNL